MLIRSGFSNRGILAKQRAVTDALFTRHSLAPHLNPDMTTWKVECSDLDPRQ